MLTIRLQRKGKKNQPFFKIVVTEEKKSSTGGRFVEELGFYNPLTKERALKGDRAKYWMSVGAQPSDTVYNMLVTDNIIEGKKRPQHKKSKKKQPEVETTPAAETPIVVTPAEGEAATQESAKAEEATKQPKEVEVPQEQLQKTSEAKFEKQPQPEASSPQTEKGQEKPQPKTDKPASKAQEGPKKDVQRSLDKS